MRTPASPLIFSDRARHLLLLCSLSVFLQSGGDACAQSLGSAGTIDGIVRDPSNAVVPHAKVTLSNPLTNFKRSVQSDDKGAFRLPNLPFNTYHVDVTATGFNDTEQDVVVRSTVPVSLTIQLKLAGSATEVTVESTGADLLENVPYAHSDLDQSAVGKLPTFSPGSGLSDAITMTSGAVVADSNGFFHPLGDHAQTSFSIDGQPISDQQSKQFSTQIPLNAIQSMELITGAPPAEYGDKTSLVVSAVTKSGLGQKPFGSLVGQWGSFGTWSEEGSVGFGGKKFGNFLSFNALTSGRFLDTPEFMPIHAKGNNGTLFDRLDYQPTQTDIFHLNLFVARNWFQVPNTYDQPNQDQRQRVNTWNIAPGYQHTFSGAAVLTFNPFIRQDRVNYYPSRDPFADSPATLSQQRRLTNYGFKLDLSYVRGRHNIKVGTQIMQTRLREQFSLGLTDPTYNPVCVGSRWFVVTTPSLTDPAQCAAAGYAENPDFSPGLLPFDLTRGGSLFNFNGKANINQYAFYGQDSITWGQLNLQLGLRIDQYNGITSDTGVQPRVGLSYQIKPTGTVLRGAYSRTFETPYNENLVVSSMTGVGGLAQNFGAYGSRPLQPGSRDQYNIGLQQSLDHFLLIDADYFWKFTDRAYDFDTLLNTPVQFPIEWRKSKLDGFAIRISTANFHGFQAYTTMGHTRARFFGPEIGGLLFNSPVNDAVFRIDHDQAFQQTTNLRYQHGHDGPWISFTWRYDSGMVSGAVASLDDALALTGAQQAAIGFYCGSQFASVSQPITACADANFGATRIKIPPEGTANDDHNPPRIAPRHLFDLGFGTDNLLRKEHYKTTLRFTVTNLTNNVALYNFLSTFSGTHFVTPRSYQAAIGFVF